MATSPRLREELRAKGYRMTLQRQLVLDAVSRLGHATPDEVHAAVADSGINLSTVYRTLELLEELELVTHTHLGHGAATYHSTTDDAHVHLVCRGCGRVIDAAPELVEDAVGRLQQAHGFAADVHHMAIFGLCRGCDGQG